MKKLLLCLAMIMGLLLFPQEIEAKHYRIRKLYFSSSNYIQNETIFANSYYNYNGTPLIIGYDVTTGMSYGNVNLKSGSKVSIQN